MNNRLDQNQQEKISRKYHEHPLLCACQLAFRNYQARMRYLMFSPVEVFVEAIKVIDDILEEGTDRKGYINNLWENLTIRYKLWCTGVPDDNEFQIAVSSVFYAVSITMSTHNHTYYKDIIKDALLKEIDSHTSVVKQEEDKVIVALSQYADELKNWLDSYIVSDSYLSDDIDDVAHGRRPRSLVVAINKGKKKDKKDSVKPKADYSKYSFNYIPKVFTRREIANRLSAMFVDLKQWGFIDNDTTEEKFSTVFTGVDTTDTITWTGYRNELWYLIKTMNDKKILEWKHPGPRIWQLTAYRFKLREEVFKEDENGIKHKTFEIHSLKAEDFKHDSRPEDTTKLDMIIMSLLPKSQEESIHDEIMTETTTYSDYMNNNENDTGEILQKGSGFKDRSHKSNSNRK